MEVRPADGDPATSRSRSLFLYDLGWSFRCWATNPLFVILAVALQVAPVALTTGTFTTVLAIMAWLVLAAFLGTERIFYLRAYEGQRLAWSQVVPLTGRFLVPFLGLGFLMVVPLLVIFVPTDVAVRIATHASSHRPLSFPTWERWTAVGLGFVYDVALTFVVPALAFTWRDPRGALRHGLAMLRGTWPLCSWYVIAPGITLVAVARLLPRSVVGYGGAVGLAVVAGVLAVALRGAIVPFYLRRNAPVGPDGTAGTQLTSPNGRSR